jgi:hypothetical protein
MPERQERRQHAALEGGNGFRRQGKPSLPPISERHARVGSPLQPLQDCSQRRLEQSCDQLRFESGTEDGASAQYLEHIRREGRPIKRGSNLLRGSLASNLDHRRRAIFMAHQIDQFCDQALRCTPHGQEQRQPQPPRALENLGQGGHRGLVGRIDRFKDEYRAPIGLVRKPVACLHQQGIEGLPGHVTQKPLAESRGKRLSHRLGG